MEILCIYCVNVRTSEVGIALSAKAQDSVLFAACRLEVIFTTCFAAEYRTRLSGGAQEPLYQPAADPAGEHQLWYREDYFASALHETAHWCIAGSKRRELLDFGYWYAPDGRNQSQQQAFELAESKPQALEWLFSRACGYRFCLSADNLDGFDGQVPDSSHFRQRVFEQARLWQRHGLPPRAARFFQALSHEFATSQVLSAMPLSMDELQ